MTTFARIAKIIKGVISPKNWIEEAFAELADGGSGDSGGIFTVTVTGTADGDDVVFERASATSDEIMTAVEENKCPILFFNIVAGSTISHAVLYFVDNENGARFVLLQSDGGIKIAADGTASLVAY